MSPLLFSYISVTFFLVLTPGATTAVVIQHTLRHGRRSGVLAAAGAASANSTYALLTGLGVSLLFRRFPDALSFLRLAGAAYLSWLGLRSLIRAMNASALSPAAASVRSSALRDGWTVTILNPSIATFYVAVLPGFLPPSPTAGAFALLGAIHVTMAFTCHLAWTAVLGRLRAWFARPRPLRALDAVAGLALLALGIRMLVA